MIKRAAYLFFAATAIAAKGGDSFEMDIVQNKIYAAKTRTLYVGTPMSRMKKRGDDTYKYIGIKTWSTGFQKSDGTPVDCDSYVYEVTRNKTEKRWISITAFAGYVNAKIPLRRFGGAILTNYNPQTLKDDQMPFIWELMFEEKGRGPMPYSLGEGVTLSDFDKDLMALSEKFVKIIFDKGAPALAAAKRNAPQPDGH